MKSPEHKHKIDNNVFKHVLNLALGHSMCACYNGASYRILIHLMFIEYPSMMLTQGSKMTVLSYGNTSGKDRKRKGWESV